MYFYCSSAAPVVEVNVNPDIQKYLGVVDFNSIIYWYVLRSAYACVLMNDDVPRMMSTTWGQTPSDVEELRTLRDAFKTTKVADLLGNMP